MVRASPIISALNAGEWSPLLNGRVDIEGYSASAYKLENFMPTVQGPIIRRAGTRFVRAVKDSTDRTWLVPFVRSRQTAYVIEFGESYCRFYYQRSPVLTGTTTAITGITAANPPVVTSAGHGYSNGDEVFITGVAGMTEVNNRWFVVANKTASTYELTTIHGDNVDGSAYTAYSSGGTADTPYEIASPYSAAGLATTDGEFNLDVVQTGDVLYIADRSGTLAPRKLSRTSATSWAFSTLTPNDGPWLDTNATTTTMYVSAATGTITITASASVFSANDVGSLIRIDQETLTSSTPWKASTAYTTGDYVRSEGKEYVAASTATSGTTIPSHTSGTVSDGGVNWTYVSPGYGIARITAQGGTTATATVLTTFPQTIVGSGNATTLWRKGAWSGANGYPTCVTFFRERLCWGQGQRIDTSVTASFESMAVDYFGEILPESAISVTVQSSEANDITSLTEGTVMIVNTIGAEFVLDAPASSEPFGPNNVRVSRQTTYGSRPVRSVRIGPSVLFLQASGRRVRSMQYTFDVDSFTAPDMTVRAEHIARPSITAMVRQEEPYQTIWCVRSDGEVLSFAFDQSQQVRAWARHILGGTDTVVEHVAVIPSTDGERDDVWCVVSRTINGATRRYIEYIQSEFLSGDDQEDSTYGDASLTYDGSATTVLYGFDHLEGETVGVMSDGASHPDVTVSNGEVTVTSSASVIQVGLRYASKYASNTIEAGAKEGTAQAKIKRIIDCAFRVIDTLGGSAGPSETNLDEIRDLNYRAPATLMGQPSPLFTGDALVPWPGGYETDGRIWYVNDSMFPATISAIMPQVDVEESR